MQKLTSKEEEVMRALWKLKKAFVKEVIPELEETLHYNTVSTLVRNLEEKDYVSYQAFGKTHQYFPLISQEEYSKSVVNSTAQKFFEGSYKNLVSFFAKEEKISTEELREIIDLIEKNKS